MKSKIVLNIIELLNVKQMKFNELIFVVVLI